MRAKHRVPAGAVLIAFLGACADNIREAPPEAWLINRSGRAVIEVRYRPCGTNGDDWQPLLTAPSGIWDRSLLALPLDCVDLQAFHVENRLAGTQTNVKRKFPFRWELR